MAHYERDKDDHRVFDGGEDEDDGEGSQLPVVIIAAILVLAAFGGVVWLAYNQGVARGRGDATPRIAMTDASKTGGDNGLKVYQDRAGGDEDENAAKPGASPSAAAANQIAQAAPSATPTPVVPKAPAAVAPPPAPPPQQSVAVAPVPVTETPITPAPKAAAPVKMAQATPAKETSPAVAKSPAKQTVTPGTPASTTSSAPTSPPAVATKPPTPLGLARPAAVTPIAPAAKTEVAKAPPVTAPAATKTVATAKVAAGSFLLQVGAYKSEEEATAAWKSYQAKHAALLSGFGPDIQRATVGDKVWYRLRIASFADKDTASAVCDRLKAQNGNCFLAH